MLSVGEQFHSASGNAVTIKNLVLQSSWSWTSFETFITAGEEQLILADAVLDWPDDHQRFNSLSSNRGRYYGHPTPQPPRFTPTLVAEVDGTRYEPTTSVYDYNSGTLAFDLPAEPASRGHVRWTDPSPLVRWRIPSDLLNRLNRRPRFTLHSAKLTFDQTDSTVAVEIDVENTSPWKGPYRYIIFAWWRSDEPPKRIRSNNGHYSVAGSKVIDAHSRVTFTEQFSFQALYTCDRCTIWFDDGRSKVSITPTPTPESSPE